MLTIDLCFEVIIIEFYNSLKGRYSNCEQSNANEYDFHDVYKLFIVKKFKIFQ